MEDSVSDGVELEVLEDSLDLTAFDVEVDSEDVWRVDEVTYAVLAYGEVEYFVASVEDCGDLITSAEALSGLLNRARCGAGLRVGKSSFSLF